MNSISQATTSFDPFIFLDTTGCGSDTSPSTSKSAQVYRSAKECQTGVGTDRAPLKKREIYRRPENAKNCLLDRLFPQAVNKKRKREEAELCSLFFSTYKLPNSSKKRKILPQRRALDKSSFVEQNGIILSLDNLIDSIVEVLKNKEPKNYKQKDLENEISELSSQYTQISKKREQLGETGFESEWNPRITEIIEFLAKCRYLLCIINTQKINAQLLNENEWLKLSNRKLQFLLDSYIFYLVSLVTEKNKRSLADLQKNEPKKGAVTVGDFIDFISSKRAKLGKTPFDAVWDLDIQNMRSAEKSTRA